MALMTGEQYIESIRKIPMEIYMFGKKVENPVDDPILRPSLNSVRMTYDLAQMPEYQDLMTVVSPETGERINRHLPPHRGKDQPLHPHPSLHRGSPEQGEDAALVGPEDRRLLPALRWHGCIQRRVLHHL